MNIVQISAHHKALRFRFTDRMTTYRRKIAAALPQTTSWFANPDISKNVVELGQLTVPCQDASDIALRPVAYSKCLLLTK